MSDFAFEPITDEELKKETTTTRTTKTKEDISDRTQTGWFRLPHVMGFCTVPKHDDLQKILSDRSEDASYWRQKYPTRMTYLIHPYHVCRDCYVNEIDNECRDENLDPLVFNG